MPAFSFLSLAALSLFSLSLLGVYHCLWSCHADVWCIDRLANWQTSSSRGVITRAISPPQLDHHRSISERLVVIAVPAYLTNARYWCQTSGCEWLDDSLKEQISKSPLDPAMTPDDLFCVAATLDDGKVAAVEREVCEWVARPMDRLVHKQSPPHLYPQGRF